MLPGTDGMSGRSEEVAASASAGWGVHRALGGVSVEEHGQVDWGPKPNLGVRNVEHALGLDRKLARGVAQGGAAVREGHVR